MTVNTNTLISITEANQNFSKVYIMFGINELGQNGSAVILKNNGPRYIVLEFSEVEKVQMAADEDVADISQRLIAKNLEAYKELAK